MDTIITIPTKDRPKELKRLLLELTRQKQKYDHTLPIRVYDHSEEGSAQSIIALFQGQLDINYFGQEHRTELISDISNTLSLDEEIVHRTFSQGYGGNRNCILATNPKKAVISIDDDIIPISLEPPSVMPANKRISLNDCHEERYDFSDLMTKWLGQNTDDTGLGVAWFKGGDYVVEPVYKDAEIIRCFPALHYDSEGFEKFVPNKKQKFVMTGLIPSILVGQVVPYGCIAYDHTSISHVPFVPTKFPYEDLLHSDMVNSLQIGASVMIGKSVIHKKGIRPNINFKAVYLNYKIADLSRIFIISILNLKKDFDNLSSYLRNSLENPQVFNAIFETRLNRGTELELQYSRRKDIQSELDSSLRREMEYAADTLEVWPRIIEYMNNKT